MNKIKISLVVVVILIIIFMFFNNKEKTDTVNIAADGNYNGVIKVGHLVATDMAPMFIAKEAGYFKEEGLDIETIFFSNPGDNNAALTGGSIKFMINPFTLAYLGVNGGVPMRIITNAGGDGVIQVIAQGELNLNSIKDLSEFVKKNPSKKLKVGTLRGDTLDMILYRSFIDNDLTYDDFEVIWFNDLLSMVQSFKTKDIDILSHIQPYTIDLQKNYNGKLLTDNSKVWGEGTPNTTTIVLDNFAKKYPETVKKYIRAINKSLELIKSNPTEAIKILNGKNYFRVPDDVLRASFESQKKATLIPNEEGMNIAIKDMVAQGYLEEVNVEVIDTSYLEEALK